MQTLAQRALAAGSLHMNGTEGSVLIVLLVVGAVLLMRRRGSGGHVIALTVLGVVIALALLGGWHLYSPRVP